MTCDSCHDESAERRRLLVLDRGSIHEKRPRRAWLLCPRCSIALEDLLDQLTGKTLPECVALAKEHGR